MATLRDDAALVELLLLYGAPIDASTKVVCGWGFTSIICPMMHIQGYTAVHIATSNAAIDVLEVLLRYGADTSKTAVSPNTRHILTSCKL